MKWSPLRTGVYTGLLFLAIIAISSRLSVEGVVSSEYDAPLPVLHSFAAWPAVDIYDHADPMDITTETMMLFGFILPGLFWAAAGFLMHGLFWLEARIKP